MKKKPGFSDSYQESDAALVMKTGLNQLVQEECARQGPVPFRIAYKIEVVLSANQKSSVKYGGSTLRLRCMLGENILADRCGITSRSGVKCVLRGHFDFL